MPRFVCEERLAYGSWRAFERSVARLVEHAGFTDVSVVGGSGDYGADVVGTFNGARWVLQAKFRSSGNTDQEGINEVVRALTKYEADVAVVVTNRTFNPRAHNRQIELVDNGFNVKLWDGAYLLDYMRHLADDSMGRRSLREYQLEAVDAVERARSEGRSSALVLMATGLGKSIVANQIVLNEIQRNPGQEILVCAHTVDLVRQLEQSSWSQYSKQVSTHVWSDGEIPAYRGGVVFATWQSLIGENNVADISNRFSLVIVDEAHHAPSNAYRKLINTLQPRFLVGLTATPWRGDERDLGDLFGDAVYRMDIVDGLQKGYLANVDYHMLTDGIDWDEIALMSKQGCTIRDLNARLILPDRDEAMVSEFSQRFKSLAKGRAIVFCKSIEYSDRLRSMILAEGLRAATLHSRQPREIRFVNLSGFRSGNIDVLIAVDMLNEGIDVPDVNLIAFMRVTHSRRIFVQQLGRGLRLSKGKSEVLVLDFVADIRRIAAGHGLNKAAISRSGGPEVIRFKDGRIVHFADSVAENFCSEYLKDVAEFEEADESAQLHFPES